LFAHHPINSFQLISSCPCRAHQGPTSGGPRRCLKKRPHFDDPRSSLLLISPLSFFLSPFTFLRLDPTFTRSISFTFPFFPSAFYLFLIHNFHRQEGLCHIHPKSLRPMVGPRPPGGPQRSSRRRPHFDAPRSSLLLDLSFILFPFAFYLSSTRPYLRPQHFFHFAIFPSAIYLFLIHNFHRQECLPMPHSS